MSRTEPITPQEIGKALVKGRPVKGALVPLGHRLKAGYQYYGRRVRGHGEVFAVEDYGDRCFSVHLSHEQDPFEDQGLVLLRLPLERRRFVERLREGDCLEYEGTVAMIDQGMIHLDSEKAVKRSRRKGA